MYEFAVVWTVDDIIKIEPNLSKEEAELVLNELAANYEKDVGISSALIKARITVMRFHGLLNTLGL